MIVNGKTLDVISMCPQIESGLEWVKTGDVLHVIDYGVASDRYSATVAATGNYNDVMDVWHYLSANITQSIYINTSKQIFGCHLVHGTVSVRVKSVNPPELLYSNFATLEFTLMLNNSVFIPESIALDLNQLCITKVNRNINYGVMIGNTETSNYGINAGAHVRTTSITVQGKHDQIAPMLRYIANSLRGNILAVATSACWLFDDEIYSDDVRITSISNLTPIDKACNWWAFDMEMVKQ